MKTFPLDWGTQSMGMPLGSRNPWGCPGVLTLTTGLEEAGHGCDGEVETFSHHESHIDQVRLHDGRAVERGPAHGDDGE